MSFRILVLAGGALLVANVASAAPLEDSDYCQQLSSLYRIYARANQVSNDAANAMHDCDTGKAASAIQTLTKILTDNKITVPKR